MKPGDVFVTNDPWLGTGHLFDFVVVTPVFLDGEPGRPVRLDLPHHRRRRRRLFGRRQFGLRGRRPASRTCSCARQAV